MDTPSPSPGKPAPRDEAAFVAMVDAYQGPLLRYAARLLGNASVAEDVVQRTFIKCAASWKGSLAPSDELSAWLYRVAHNEALDVVRRERRRGLLHRRKADEDHHAGTDIQPPPTPGGDSVPDDALYAAEALRRLSDRDRLIVTLKVYEEKSYREIADIMGITVSNVGVTLHNALKKLADMIVAARRKDLP